jgi:hypothetical protein
MNIHLTARSIARPIQKQLQPWTFNARVLATFARVCNLATAAGEVLALVAPEVDDGPLNIVLAAALAVGEEGPVTPVEVLATLKPGMPARMEDSVLLVGNLAVDLAKAVPWEPRPDWDALRARHASIARHIAYLQEVSLEKAPEESLLCLLQGSTADAPESVQAVQAALKTAGSLLRSGWAGDLMCLREGVAWLAGLGGGLTPAGDDFLCGIMLAAWLAHPDPVSFCRGVVETAVSRTTILSAAFLRAAGRGECRAAWHRLLPALAAGARDAIAAAAQDVEEHGATSGADALTGFVTGCLYGLPA